MLDDLVGVIETVKERIQNHRDALQANETRTRMVLIDPLLQVLGWDTADLELVMPEYEVSSKRADYALLRGVGPPIVFLEAKRLDEPLSNHRSQVAAYASELGIKYPALTNGNQWEVYDNSKLVPIEQRRILEVSIANDPAHETALQLLLLWRPNLGSGQPLPANVPILNEPVQSLPTATVSDAAGPPSQPAPSALGPGWTPLSDFVAIPYTKPPSPIRFPDGTQYENKFWTGLLVCTAKWLCDQGILTTNNVPVPSSEKRYIVNTAPQHPTGKDFDAVVQIAGTELFVEGGVSAKRAITQAKNLLAHCNQDARQVYLHLGN